MSQPHIIDDRIFLIGLDELYRQAMQQHERHELLGCARDVARTLRVAPKSFPVEGYYGQDASLTEYFALMRTLQELSDARIREVKALLSYQRLCQVLSSPIFGSAVHERTLLPVGRDPLSEALTNMRPYWSIATLTTAAHAAARASSDCSLVGLAALMQDPIALTALRESVVLYAGPVEWTALSRPAIGWAVDPELAERAARFIALFRALFGTQLPAPAESNAEVYWSAYQAVAIVGRCVRLGWNEEVDPTHYYHWAIDHGPMDDLVVREFWHTDVWTTDRYRRARAVHQQPAS